MPGSRCSYPHCPLLIMFTRQPQASGRWFRYIIYNIIAISQFSYLRLYYCNICTHTLTHTNMQVNYYQYFYYSFVHPPTHAHTLHTFTHPHVHSPLCRAVFLTSPLLGTLALSLVTPLSIAYSIVVGKVS